MAKETEGTFPEPKFGESMTGCHAYPDDHPTPTLDELNAMIPIMIECGDPGSFHALMMFREDAKYMYCINVWSRGAVPEVLKLDKSVFRRVMK